MANTYEDIKFTKGGLDEQLAYDRYVVSTNDVNEMNIGDIVVVITDKTRDVRRVGTITNKQGDSISVHTYQGEDCTVDAELVTKPLELTPQQMWERWAKGASSVEDNDKQKERFDQYMNLLRGFGYSPGGRIQLMLGQEFVTGKKANLTGYNCFVLGSPKRGIDSVDQWRKVLDSALEEIRVMRRGGGAGFDLSDIETIPGAGKTNITLYLPHTHKDYTELLDKKSIGKFNHVEIRQLNESESRYVVDDSIEGLVEAMYDMVRSAYRHESIKLDFTNVRHRHAYVNGVNGRSSGAESWMEMFDLIASLLQLDEIDAVEFAEIFSAIVHLIEQGGSRRGALMEIISVLRRDIIRKFITRKQISGKLSGANISVAINDKFMEDLFFGDEECEEIWNMIVESAHKSAEPGVVFLERANKESNSWYFNPLAATNPCLHKDSYMVTENGLEKISQLKSPIWNTEGYVKSNSWQTGVKKVVRLMTNSGFEYVVTPDHKFLLDNGEWAEAIDTIGENIVFDFSEKEWIGFDPYTGDVDYKILGFILGDGGWHKASNRMKYVFLTYGKDSEVEDYIHNKLGWGFDWKDNNHYECEIPNKTPYAHIFSGKIGERTIPDWIMQLPKQKMGEFLSGLFSANGTNLKKRDRIQLVSINKEMLQQVQQMLLLFGIKAKLWYHNKKHDVKFDNGTYTCKLSYHLVISRKSYERFLDNIGFIQSYKNGYTTKNRHEETDYETVILISEMDDAEVWDFHESNQHRGVVSGAVVHNCGEQPLPEYGVCNLGHVVLPVHAKGDKIGAYSVNNELLESTVRSGVRFQDAIIDYTDYFLDKNREVQMSERRIGMGTMGLGTLLIQLGLRYGSDPALKFANELYSKIAYWAYDESINIAKEKGAFPKFQYDEFVESGFMKRLIDKFPQLDEKLKKYGIRNVTILTQAPTGSTGTLLDNIKGFNCSTGIEPYFGWSYYRASRGGGVTAQEVEIVQQYRDENGLSDSDPLPDFFVTAMELKPEEHVYMQSVIQKWVDSAISKTANAPSDYTVEDVDNLYRLGYNLGLKGITVYVANSREAQVLATNEKDAKLEMHIEADKIESLGKDHEKLMETLKSVPGVQEHLDKQIAKRPTRLFGFTEKVKVPLGNDGRLGKVYITVNVSEDGKPYEIFVNANDAEIRSTGAALGRMATQFLRYGDTRDNVEQTIKHLRKGEHMGSLPFIIASLLERVTYGKIQFPGQQVTEHKIELQICAKCGEQTYDKGSCTCINQDCGYSSCN